MHSRNIYKTKPNFTELGKQYDFLAPFVTLDERGNGKINFKDPQALRGLTKALLLHDFGLDVTIPEQALVPTVPLRLNYILWVEDLLMEMGVKKDSVVRGIDVGTGATGVYALLAAKTNGWYMVGTEVDPEYVGLATVNVDRNGLSNLIEIVQTEKKGPVMEPVLMEADDGYYTFTMCNPPFFGSEEETDSVGKGRFSKEEEPLRPPPSGGKTGRATELVAEGGEVLFVQGMIQESLKYPKKVMIYTTMLGIKRHLKHLVSYLRTHQIVNYTTAEFVQGKTMRWGLAWSFVVPLLPPNPDLVVPFPNFSPLLHFEGLMSSYLEQLKFYRMDWLSSALEDADDQQSTLEILATKNTWSHQRRKRRMEKRLKEMGAVEGELAPKSVKHDSSDQVQVQKSSHEPSTEAEHPDPKQVLLHCYLDFAREDDGTAKISMRFRDGTLGKEGLHQIMQYLKNKYDSDQKNPSSQVYKMLQT